MSEPATREAPSTSGRRARVLAAAWWFGLAPLLASLGTMRWLVPAPAEIDPGAWGRIAALANAYPLPLAIAFFLLYAGLVRAWGDRLPLGGALLARSAEPAPARTLPQRITSVAVVVLAALAALTVRGKVGQLYEVSGASMLPTLLPGDTLIVSKLGRQAPRRGDIVAFRARTDETGGATAVEDQLVKRVVGLPGDHVRTRAGIPVINGWEVPHCDAGTYVRYAANGTLAGRLLVEFLEDRAFLAVHVPGTKSFAGYEVRPGEVFVLGDDRSNSNDSRSWSGGRGRGVPLASIDGQPWRVIGADANGRVDLGRLFHRTGLRLDLAGVDPRGLEAGIDRCLKERPKQTWPPPPPKAAPTSSPA